jgi:hypothetical protein
MNNRFQQNQAVEFTRYIYPINWANLVSNSGSAFDVNSKYIINGFLYLGKDEGREPLRFCLGNLSLKLVESHAEHGGNIIMENFFFLFFYKCVESD